MGPRNKNSGPMLLAHLNCLNWVGADWAVPNVGGGNPQESGRKAPLSCNAAFSTLHCSFLLVASQLLVKMTSALQKSQCCSATSAAQHSENCSATSVFACGMLQGSGLEGWGLGLAEPNAVSESTVSNTELSEFFGPH